MTTIKVRRGPGDEASLGWGGGGGGGGGGGASVRKYEGFDLSTDAHASVDASYLVAAASAKCEGR